MATLFSGGEADSFIPTGGAPSGSTNSARFDATYSRVATFANTAAATNTLKTPVYAAAATTHWFHVEGFSPSANQSTATLRPISFYDSSGVLVFKLSHNGTTNNLQGQYWNGATFTNIGSVWVYANSTRYIIDIKVVCGGSGSFELYVGGTLITSGSASMTSVANIKQAELMNVQSGLNPWHWSQVVCADEQTIGWKVYSVQATGDSAANTGFAGSTFTAISEAILDDTTFLSSTSANEVRSFTVAQPTLGSGTVKAVVVGARANTDGSTPANLQLALRRAGTNYFSSSVSGIAAGLNGFINIWSIDPFTGLAWTAANAVAAANEFGMKSIT